MDGNTPRFDVNADSAIAIAVSAGVAIEVYARTNTTVGVCTGVNVDVHASIVIGISAGAGIDAYAGIAVAVSTGVSIWFASKKVVR